MSDLWLDAIDLNTIKHVKIYKQRTEPSKKMAELMHGRR